MLVLEVSNTFCPQRLYTSNWNGLTRFAVRSPKQSFRPSPLGVNADGIFNVSVGYAFTSTVTEASASQPSTEVAVTVYSVEDAGFAIGLGELGSSKPIAGLHWYDAPPLACNCTSP